MAFFLFSGWLSPFYILSSLALGVILARYVRNRGCNPNRLPLPPGPKGYPIIGSLFDMPTVKPWLKYHEWSKIYGDMVYFEVLGQSFLILDTLERTNDLLEKRSSNYSDRIRLPMLNELSGWEFSLAVMRYGTRWRKYRRVFHEYFNSRAVERYLPIQERETKGFLRRILASPEELIHHIRIAFAATVMDICYGIRIENFDDPYIARAEIAVNSAVEATIPGSFLVDILPWMKYIPSWVPGAGFQKKAAYWKANNALVCKVPFGFVKEQYGKGIAPPSISATLISRFSPESDPAKRAEQQDIAEGVNAIAYIAGADTTVSSVQFFFLAMTMHPEVMRKAQEEIDSVIGRNRLPEISDKDSLPYVNAVAKETMRWHSVLPLGVAHSAKEDDEYNGYFIPKGTVVMGNSWAILHDPDAFEDPSSFNPDRYIKDGKLNHELRDPTCAFFGFGRRICPGRHLSQPSFFLTISSVLAVFDIHLPKDENGKPVEYTPDVTSGLIIYPTPFPCKITPRDSQAEKLIHEIGFEGP